jgi:hypothetical protein
MRPNMLLEGCATLIGLADVVGRRCDDEVNTATSQGVHKRQVVGCFKRGTVGIRPWEYERCRHFFASIRTISSAVAIINLEK